MLILIGGTLLICVLGKSSDMMIIPASKSTAWNMVLLLLFFFKVRFLPWMFMQRCGEKKDTHCVLQRRLSDFTALLSPLSEILLTVNCVAGIRVCSQRDNRSTFVMYGAISANIGICFPSLEHKSGYCSPSLSSSNKWIVWCHLSGL